MVYTAALDLTTLFEVIYKRLNQQLNSSGGYLKRLKKYIVFSHICKPA